jgi:hypothetical protein
MVQGLAKQEVKKGRMEAHTILHFSNTVEDATEKMRQLFVPLFSGALYTV